MTSRSGGELPQLELECLAALWALEAAPVTRVRARLAEHGRTLAHTTVLTVLERLVRKQAVTRRRQGRAYVYQPLVPREAMLERSLDRLVRNYFASRQELLRYLHGEPVLLPSTSAVAAAPTPPSTAAAPITTPAVTEPTVTEPSGEEPFPVLLD